VVSKSFLTETTLGVTDIQIGDFFQDQFGPQPFFYSYRFAAGVFTTPLPIVPKPIKPRKIFFIALIFLEKCLIAFMEETIKYRPLLFRLRDFVNKLTATVRCSKVAEGDHSSIYGFLSSFKSIDKKNCCLRNN